MSEPTLGTLEYNSNNSGGDWWLSDDDWLALEAAGWIVAWLPERWLGAKARRATFATNDPGVAIAEWASLTGEDPDAEGCNCCGHPHEFSFTDSNGVTKHSYIQVTGTERVWS